MDFKQWEVKPWTDEEIDFLFENYSHMSVKEIAKRLDRRIQAVRSQAANFGLRRDFGAVEFAVYEGETFLEIGTRDELVDKLGITRNRLYTMASPSYHKKFKKGSNAMIAYRLDDMEGIS